MNARRLNLLFAILLIAAPLPAQQRRAKSAPPPVPLGLMPVMWPKSNPYSPEKAELGKLLYFDTRLSADGTVSCATCHSPKFAFTDGAAVSTGIRGQKGGRSAPTVINRAFSLAQFWDGRAGTLEEQAKGPMANPIEMGNTHDTVVSTVKAVPGYRALFAKVFSTNDFGIEEIAKAIATFERTVLSGNSPYDRYKEGDEKAMNAAQIRGMDIYFNKAKCDQCHEGLNFTTNMYANIGIGTDKPQPDEGRYAVTKNPADWGTFKTPTLRDISRTAPYMHDGSLKTLEEVVDYYNKGGRKNKNLDEKIKPLHLTAQDQKDLIGFLHALDGEGWEKIQAPSEFPK